VACDGLVFAFCFVFFLLVYLEVANDPPFLQDPVQAMTKF